MAAITIDLIAKKLKIPVQELQQELRDKAHIVANDDGVINDQDKAKLAMFMKAKMSGQEYTLTRKVNQNLQGAKNVKVQITKSQTVKRTTKPKAHVEPPVEAVDTPAVETDQSPPPEASPQTPPETPPTETPQEVEQTIPEETPLDESVAPADNLATLTLQERLARVQPIEPLRKGSPPAPKSAATSKEKPGKRSLASKAKNDDTFEQSSASKPKRNARRRAVGDELVANPNKLRSLNLRALEEDDADSENATRKPIAEPATIKIKTKHTFQRPLAPKVLEVAIGSSISVKELARKLALKPNKLVKLLARLGESASQEDQLDYDTAHLAVEDLGHTVIRLEESTPESELMERLAKAKRGAPEPRAPVVTVMGHVDHGKTTLLDTIRKTKVASGEAGGITQHLSAYHVPTEHGIVTFVDTPGHAAFTAMRARGARFTDIVVLIVAADDGVKPQTVEIIQHVKAAEVPLVVAINKIDKEQANAEKVLQGLAQHDVLTERWGGDIPVVEISATTGQGIDDLMEMLLLQAEVLELTAPPSGVAQGYVLECRLEQGRGVIANILVQSGCLKRGDILLSGSSYGRVRVLLSSDGATLKQVGPSIPVELMGFNDLPQAGDDFVVVDTEKTARQVAAYRIEQARNTDQQQQQTPSLENLFSAQDDEQQKQVSLIIKADTQGSVEALNEALNKLSSDKIKVNIVGTGVGGISESDATLAMAHQAIIIGFNTRADKSARSLAEKHNLSINYYSIIYEAVDDIEKALLGELDAETREKIIGVAEVRDIFVAKKYGNIAGCMVVEGEIRRNAPIRVLRENIVIYQGELESLRRLKADVNSVRAGLECGIGVHNYKDVRIGDRIEVFERIEVRPTSLS